MSNGGKMTVSLHGDVALPQGLFLFLHTIYSKTPCYILRSAKNPVTAHNPLTAVPEELSVLWIARYYDIAWFWITTVKRPYTSRASLYICHCLQQLINASWQTYALWLDSKTEMLYNCYCKHTRVRF